MSITEYVLAIAEERLSLLIRPEARVAIDVSTWDLPVTDRVALATHGLPNGPLLAPAPQAAPEPMLVPNVATDRERRLVAPTDRLYRLGGYGYQGGPSPISIGVLPGTGRVLGIRPAPMTIDDIAPQLRPYYPSDLYNPAVYHFNASVAAFVEIAWRWHAVVEVLRAHRAPDFTAPFTEQEGHYTDQRRAREEFIARMAALDPSIGGPDSVWVSSVLDDY